MPWLLPTTTLSTALPAHCTPENDFLLQLSSTFNTCIPTPLALLSTLLGILSIIAWLCAQIPQIYKNWRFQSTSGLSIYFLVEWFLGDVSNLLGALFTHQASWQVAIGAYYVLVDTCLLAQWIWYEKLRHGQPILRLSKRRKDGQGRGGAGQGTNPSMAEGRSTLNQAEGEARLTQGHTAPGQTAPKIIFRSPTFDQDRAEVEKSSLGSSGQPATPRGRSIYRPGNGPSSSFPTPSPRTMMMVACLIAVVAASPIQQPSTATARLDAPFLMSAQSSVIEEAPPTPLEQVGSLLAWMSTFLYLGSRLPQLLLNFQRKSTAGLSFHLFLAAFCGNLFYSAALLTNPNAWYDFEPYGGGGWADAAGNDRVRWVLAALPFFLGAAGVLGLDASVGVQFLIYGDATQKLVVLDEEAIHDSGSGDEPIRGVAIIDVDRRSSAATDDSRWHWRRVSGWMRGWIPAASELGPSGLVRSRSGEQDPLLSSSLRTGDTEVPQENASAVAPGSDSYGTLR